MKINQSLIGLRKEEVKLVRTLENKKYLVNLIFAFQMNRKEIVELIIAQIQEPVTKSDLAAGLKGMLYINSPQTTFDHISFARYFGPIFRALVGEGKIEYTPKATPEIQP